jgi:hypothetical protein
MRQTYGFTRRGLLMLAAGAGLESSFRLYAAEFWDKKDPDQWTREEINKLTTKSPWAKEVAAYTESSGANGNNGGYGNPGGGMGGGGMGRMGGMGIPGMGGGGMGGAGGMGGGRGRRGGPPTVQFKGVVRWESAKPLRAAYKTPLPDALANDYVISLSGIPILQQGRRSADNDNSDDGSTVSKGPTPEVLDRIKELTYLEPKGKGAAQPNTVQQGTSPTGETNVLLFGFSHETLQLSADDKEVSFTTQLGKLEVKTKFNLKDMMYHKELAL